MLTVLAGSLINYSAIAEDHIKHTRLKAGDPAPFDGQLLSDAAIAKLLSDTREKTRLAEVEVTHLVSTHKIKVRALMDSCRANIAAETSKVKSCLSSYEEAKKLHDKAITRLNKDLARKNKVAWYKSPYFHLTITAALIAAGSVAVIVLK